MQASPPISVCLVTYNRAQRLSATIDSIINQSFGDFELIISDDCSSDDTEEICREYARRDTRIKYIRQEVNLGMPGNLNASLQAAVGDYLANLHDGDIYHSDLLAKWKGALDLYPTTGFVFNAYRSFDGNGNEIIFEEPYQELVKGTELGQRLLSGWSSCVFGTVMARRAVYEKLGWFAPEFGNFSDVDMWLRIAREYDVAYVKHVLMDLMPRDPKRFYAFVHWQVIFWILGIHTANLKRYRVVLPEITNKLVESFFLRRRAYLIKCMLACVRHKRWDRVKEGFAIWGDADDQLLRAIGNSIGHPKHLPNWYKSTYWKMAQLQEQ